METHFKGEHHHKMDGKGRVSLPAAFRPVLKAGGGDLDGSYLFTLVHADLGGGPYVEGYTQEGIGKIYAQFEDLDEFDPDREELEHLYGTQAGTITVEPNGRFVMPEDARKQMDVEHGEVVFIGRVTRFQIWEKSAYEAHRAAKKASRPSISSPDHPTRRLRSKARRDD